MDRRGARVEYRSLHGRDVHGTWRRKASGVDREGVVGVQERGLRLGEADCDAGEVRIGNGLDGDKRDKGGRDGREVLLALR